VTVCEDETFHPAICLVALEPVSGFILLGATCKTPHRSGIPPEAA
jgi:hypothetical protein